LSAVIIVLDQTTKQAIVPFLMARGHALEIAPFFNLVLAYNKGAAFSFLSDASGWQRWFFSGIAAFASAFIVYLLKTHTAETRFCLALSLILGGALGNLWDRIALGHVVDFLDFHVAGYHWPAFNVADSAITVGAVLLVLDSFSKR